MMMMIFAHSQFDNTFVAIIFTLVPDHGKDPKTRVNNTRLDEGFYT